MRKALNIKWEYWRRVSDIEQYGPQVSRRSDAMSDASKQEIHRFLVKESAPLPTRKTVNLKREKQKRILTGTLKETHLQFLKEHPNKNISLSQFRKLCPNDILTVKEHKFNSCLCEYCLNVQFKMETINKACTSLKKEKLKLDNKYHCVELTLCPQ